MVEIKESVGERIPGKRNEEGETMEEGVRNIPGDERDCRRRRSLQLVAAEGEHSVAA